MLAQVAAHCFERVPFTVRVPSATAVPAPTGTWVIEVLDPDAGRLIASRQMPGLQFETMGGNLLYTRREDNDGFVYVDIWRVALKRPTR